MSETYDHHNPNLDAKCDLEFDASTLNLFEETVQVMTLEGVEETPDELEVVPFRNYYDELFDE